MQGFIGLALDIKCENCSDFPQYFPLFEGSIVPLVAMLSAPISSPMCSVFGRRRTMMSMTVPMTLGWLLITFATDATMILVGRALCSAVSAIAVPAAYTYVAEIASSKTRGFLGK